MLAYYLFQIAGLHPFFLYDILAVVEFSLFSWFIYLIISNRRVKRIIPVLAFLFILFSISLYIFLPENASFSSLIAGAECVLIIAMCIYYFFDQLKDSNTLIIYSSINFWIVISFLIYLSGTFFLYIYADSMMNDKAFVKQYIIINSSFIILKAILLGIAMLMKPKNSNQTYFPEEKFNDWNDDKTLQT